MKDKIVCRAQWRSLVKVYGYWVFTPVLPDGFHENRLKPSQNSAKNG